MSETQNFIEADKALFTKDINNLEDELVTIKKEESEAKKTGKKLITTGLKLLINSYEKMIQRSKKKITYIDKILEDTSFIKEIDYRIKQGYFLNIHTWIVYDAYRELLLFEESGINEKNYKRDTQHMKEDFENMKTFINQDYCYTSIQLHIPNSPKMIHAKLYKLLVDLGYKKDIYRWIASALPTKTRRTNTPRHFKSPLTKTSNGEITTTMVFPQQIL